MTPALTGSVSEGGTAAKVTHLANAVQKGVDPFSTGDVIRWQDTRGRGYAVAALKAGSAWWLTGSGALYEGRTQVTFADLTVKILSLESVQDIQVSETWAPIS